MFLSLVLSPGFDQLGDAGCLLVLISFFLMVFVEAAVVAAVACGPALLLGLPRSFASRWSCGAEAHSRFLPEAGHDWPSSDDEDSEASCEVNPGSLGQLES